ncbi:MAG TPA: hypothetical protein VL201_00690 [Patescibacteria group bacterium]|jgi:hypothetical protein|nr:hypothetical protein [Patescibacteria group bacterium]
MKHYIPCLLLIGIVAPVGIYATNESSDTDVSGRSYLAIQPHFHSSSPELVSGFRGNYTHKREDGWHGAMQFVLFGSRSTHSDNLARYFFPFGKTSLIASVDYKEFKGLPFADTDILATNFNVFTVGDVSPTTAGFKSRISIKPRQTVVGFGIHYRQSIYRNEENERGFWFDVTLPIIHVKNEMNLEETILNTDNDNTPNNAINTGVGDGPVGNMIDAFKQKGFLFGKIDDCADDMKRTRVADMELKFGYEWLSHEPCHLETYIGLIIPTGNKPKGEYMFEAVVGSGKHVGISFGSNIGVQIWADEDKERCLRVEHASHSQYLFKKDQVRSFDLKNRPWSRYLSMYKSEEEAQAAATAGNGNSFTPGINIMTREVEVTPGFSHNMNSAIIYQSKGLAVEGGYNFFARRAEHIEFDCSFPETAAIKHALGLGRTNPLRDISGTAFIETAIVSNAAVTMPVPLANYSQSIIGADDIDLASASTPCNLAHTVYGSLGYNWDEREYPMGVHFGGSYTFSNSNNSVVDRWTLWGKFTLSV